jgi:cytochrome c2
MEIGTYASALKVKEFKTWKFEEKLNQWLEENPNHFIIGTDFTSSATNDEWDITLLVYYKEGR